MMHGVGWGEGRWRQGRVLGIFVAKEEVTQIRNCKWKKKVHHGQEKGYLHTITGTGQQIETDSCLSGRKVKILS